MSDINVTPFVDVMLVLLIIFMVTAPMMVQGIDVDLPEASAKPMPTESEPLMISIDGQGRTFIDDVPVKVGFLRDKLEKIMEGRGSRAVYLRADKTIPYGVVVRVMAEIQSAGVENLGMVTVPESGEEKSQGQGNKG
jgi:biopolymer transport protein TolR